MGMSELGRIESKKKGAAKSQQRSPQAERSCEATSKRSPGISSSFFAGVLRAACSTGCGTRVGRHAGGWDSAATGSLAQIKTRHTGRSMERCASLCTRLLLGVPERALGVVWLGDKNGMKSREREVRSSEIIH